MATLILASTSVYRRELLARLGLPFETVAPGVGEAHVAHESPADRALRLALEKARAVAQAHPRAVGIGADYAVYFIFRVREEFERTGDLREATATALVTSGKAIAYVASAVAGGYLCLALSGFKVHVLLGVLVALTMLTSSAATVAFLPTVLLRATPRFLRRR